MKTIDRFADLDAMRAEKARLLLQREVHLSRLQGHILAWEEPHFRKAMTKDVVGSITDHLMPKGLLGTIIGKGGVGGGLRMAMGSGKGGVAKRAGLFALGIVAPSLLKKLERISLPEIGHEFQVSWQRLKEHVRERKEERKHEREDQENDLQDNLV